MIYAPLFKGSATTRSRFVFINQKQVPKSEMVDSISLSAPLIPSRRFSLAAAICLHFTTDLPSLVLEVLSVERVLFRSTPQAANRHLLVFNLRILFL